MEIGLRITGPSGRLPSRHRLSSPSKLSLLRPESGPKKKTMHHTGTVTTYSLPFLPLRLLG